MTDTDKMLSQLETIITALSNIVSEQKNQRTQLDVLKAKMEQHELNEKQRYEVLNARLNGSITMMKEITKHGQLQKNGFDAGNN